MVKYFDDEIESFEDSLADEYILELKQGKRKMARSKNFELDYSSQIEVDEHRKYQEAINSEPIIGIVESMIASRRNK